MAASVLPRGLAPMKAVPGALPNDEVGWAFEIKWDGMRALAAIEDGTVTLTSGRGRDVTASYPELAAMGQIDVGTGGGADGGGGGAVLLDGEVVAFDDEGVPSFSLLQQRMHVTDPAEARRRSALVPVVFVVFDLLNLGGVDATPLTYAERRKLLCDLVEDGPTWQVPRHQVGGGADLLAAAEARGMEGVVAKRLDSAYLPGRRATTWRKVKVRRTQEFVVGGWSRGEGGRAGHIGSLLLGYHPTAGAPTLRWAGNVGTGFTAAELTRLRGILAGLATDECPFDVEPRGPLVRHPTWVRPELVVQVAFAEWTPDRHLRHPSYLGTRDDTDPNEVTDAP